MSGPSPLFAVNTNTAQIAHELIYATEFRLKLDSMSNVDTYEFRVIGWSDNDISNQSLVFTDLGHGEVSGTFYADPSDTTGRSILVDCIVNGMRNAQGKLDTSLRITRVMGVPAGDGIIPAASGETFERDPKLGWLSLLKRSGGGIGATNVTASGDGTLNAFPAAAMRLAGSDGTTAGGEWSVKNKSFLDAALGENSVGLDKLHSGGATNGQIQFFNALTGNWEPGDQASAPAVPVTEILGAGTCSVDHVGTVWTVTGSSTGGTGPSPYNGTPLVESGAGSAGDSDLYARGNHVHPAAAASAQKMQIHDSCLCEITENVNVTVPSISVYDGKDLVGQDIFLSKQSSFVENGPWKYNGPSSPLTRRADWTGTVDWTYVHVFPIRCKFGENEDLAYTNGKSSGKLICTGVPYRSTIRVGTDNVLFFTVGGQETDILWHRVTVRATVDIDSTACPAVVDGHTLQDDDRILVVNKTGTALNGVWFAETYFPATSTWRLARPDDYARKSLLKDETTHGYVVMGGNLWGAHIAIQRVAGGDMTVWGASGDSATETCSWSTIGPIQDVIDVEVDAGDALSYTPPGATVDNLQKLCLTGVVYTGSVIDTDVTASQNSLVPFETVAPSDDVGGSWSQTKCTLSRDTFHTQGTYSWKMAYNSSLGGTDTASRYIYLPAFHLIRVTFKVYRESSNAFTATLNHSGTTMATASATQVTQWETVTLTSTETFTTAQGIYLELVCPTGGHFAFYLDAMQIVTYPSMPALSTRVYIDADYDPRVSSPQYNVGDTQQGQVIDAGEAWGSDRMIEFALPGTELTSNPLDVNRFFKLSVRAIPISESIAAPTLPALAGPASYPY
jgi:hypothetical protein